jgi:carbonic anhydrase
MLLRIPHAARAGRCISTSTSPLASKTPAIPTRFPALLHNQVRPFSLSWKTDLRMASEDPEKVKEVRKYLQQSHDRIFDNNKKWAAKMKEENPGFFSDLSAGQSPEYLWIGKFICISLSGSRSKHPVIHFTPLRRKPSTVQTRC